MNETSKTNAVALLDFHIHNALAACSTLLVAAVATLRHALYIAECVKLVVD
jgi:hypothetical protein